uniref:Uncharacterized protein n=1 Tax=Panagrolaimus sp. JU765 TaxID=591449 RepID=A0AC34QKM2_9BILA
MAQFQRFSYGNLYLCIPCAGVIAQLVVQGYRDQFDYAKYYVWRSSAKVPEDLIDSLDKEFISLAERKNKKFRNSKFAVSLIDNLDARTYGSFLLSYGAEFQIPVISTYTSVKQFKESNSNLLDLVKELGIKGEIPTLDLPNEKLQRLILSDAAKSFILRREITQAESVSHIIVPAAIGTACFILGYPVLKIFALALGHWLAFAAVVALSSYTTYHLLQAEAKQRVLSLDRRVLEEDKTLVKGAKDYFKARMAFCKLLNELGDAEVKKNFDENGNCTSQRASYVERMKSVVEMELKEKPKSANFRNL